MVVWIALRKITSQGASTVPVSKPIFEVNVEHPLMERLDREQDEDRFRDLAAILFEQACLAEGRQLDDPASYITRLNRLLLELSR